MRKIYLAILAIAVMTVAAASHSDTGFGRGHAQQPGFSACPQQSAWATAVWLGAGNTPIGQAIVTCASVSIDAVFWFNAQEQTWSYFFSKAPEAVNTLSALNSGQVVFLHGVDGGEPTPSPASAVPSGVEPGRYSWLDTSDPLPPDAAKIQVTDLDGWRARVQGAAGSVAANRSVVVTCLDLPNMALTTSNAQGEFTVDLYAPPGCTLQVKHDPAGLFLVSPQILTDPRPTQLTVPPATLIRHDSTTAGSTGFLLTGRVANHLPFESEFVVPYKVAGSVNALQLSAGAQLQVSGAIQVLLPAGSTVPATGANLDIGLQTIADASGRFTGGHQKFGSALETAVGSPIERWETAPPPFSTGAPVTFSGSDGVYQASFQIAQLLPADLPEGHYRLWLGLDWAGAKWATPPKSGLALSAMYTYPNERTFGPTLRIGNPAAPRLPFLLLSDAIHNGMRGVEDSAQSYRTAQRIVESASYTVLPRTDADGAPRSYRLEPVLPYLSYTDRGLVRPPFVSLRLPSGQLTATVQGPGGTTTIGPAAILQTRSSSPATVGGELLDNGGGHLGDALELTTRSSSFRHTFPTAGAYTIRVQGSVQDQSGFTWSLDGAFRIQIAESFDLDPPILPGLPFRVGEKLPIALQVNPSLPAEVEVEVRFAPNSDASRRVTKMYTGTASRYGYYFGGDSFAFDAPGEYAVEFRASYQSGDQAWAGVLAWSGVVAEESPAIVVHGRRGIDWELQPTRDRYTRASTGLPPDCGCHMNFPYWSGDVLLQTDDDAAQVRASFSDASGALRSFFTSHSNPDSGLEGVPTMAQRFDIGEAPFVSKTTSGRDPTADPSNIDLYAYYYSGVSRPGERVRAGVTEDNTDTFYWRFLEEYAAQPGLGTEGDRPTDVKFQYVGGVIRTPTRNYYGRYASLWVQLPDNDTPGSRVIAPLSEPLMRIEDEDISLFAVLTLVKPGTVLEVGDRFGLAGQVGPPIASTVHVELRSPDGSASSWDAATNEIGAFYLTDATKILNVPGIYTVTVSVKSGSATGQLFEATSFPLPVAPKGSAALKTNLPSSGVVKGLTINMAVEAAPGTQVRSLITIPGWVLEDETMTQGSQPAAFKLDAQHLQDEYPLVDTRLPHVPEPGLADEYVWVVTSGEGATLQARRIVFFGPEMWNP